MKNQLIATLVGGIILFVWQFLSWVMLDVHGAEYRYTPNEEAILEVLSQNLEEGQYMVPMVPPGATAEEEMKVHENIMGKPWASINYHPVFEMSMGMRMFRAIVINLVSIFLLTWILLKFETLNFQSALLASLAIGAIAYLTIPYLNSIWYATETLGYIIDLVVGWGLVGVWLGWWLPRKRPGRVT